MDRQQASGRSVSPKDRLFAGDVIAQTGLTARQKPARRLEASKINHEPGTYDCQEIDMAKAPFERSNHPQRVPLAPAPASASASEGMERARALARRYLPDAARLLAGIAFAPDNEAALHTRMLCAKEIVAMAGVIPQATPAPPPCQGASDSSEPN